MACKRGTRGLRVRFVRAYNHLTQGAAQKDSMPSHLPRVTKGGVVRTAYHVSHHAEQDSMPSHLARWEVGDRMMDGAQHGGARWSVEELARPKQQHRKQLVRVDGPAEM